MRTIIAGSRDITDYAVVEAAVKASGFAPTVVLSGAARGVDTLGETWAKENGVACERYPAPWDKLGRQAGVFRNNVMATSSDALIAIWDGKSRGTLHMIETAKRRGLKVYVHLMGGEVGRGATPKMETSNTNAATSQEA